MMSSPSKDGRAPRGVPAFVLDNAPIVHLHSKDPYRPSDIGSQLVNTHPQVGFANVQNVPVPLTLQNLDRLNASGGKDVYLTSKNDITTDPSWLRGVTPDASGKTKDAISAVIIVNDKGEGVVDAFYMYFFAYNAGGSIITGNDLGNHVGDWEHNMIRFQNGIPNAIWYSQHAKGQAFEYRAVKKDETGSRPLVYCARGSHALYATTGFHDHTIPGLDLPFPFIVFDKTDNGNPWDPTLAAYYYSYSEVDGGTFKAFDGGPSSEWLHFEGRWGDQQYSDNDPRQKKLFSFRKFVSGPNGPKFKSLNRKNVSPDGGKGFRLKKNLGIF